MRIEVEKGEFKVGDRVYKYRRKLSGSTYVYFDEEDIKWLREEGFEVIEQQNKLIAEQIEKDALRIQTDNTLKHTEILSSEREG